MGGPHGCSRLFTGRFTGRLSKKPRCYWVLTGSRVKPPVRHPPAMPRRSFRPKSGWLIPLNSQLPVLRSASDEGGSTLPLSTFPKSHGLSRDMSRVGPSKKPVFIDLSRCHGLGTPRGGRPSFGGIQRSRFQVRCSMFNVRCSICCPHQTAASIRTNPAPENFSRISRHQATVNYT